MVGNSCLFKKMLQIRLRYLREPEAGVFEVNHDFGTSSHKTVSDKRAIAPSFNI